MATEMSINDAVVAEVRDLVKKKGMTITGLARVSGVKYGALVNYVTRKRSPMPVDVMGQVAGAFGLTLVELAQQAEARRAESPGTPGGPDGSAE